MDREAVLELCRSLAHATEETPFGPGELTFKVGGKIFAMVSLDDEPGRLNVKDEPEVIEDSRRLWPAAVTTAPYMSKRHWNQVLLDGSVPPAEIAGMVRRSYELVFSALPRAVRAGLV